MGGDTHNPRDPAGRALPPLRASTDDSASLRGEVRAFPAPSQGSVTPQCWERTSAAGPARTRDNTGSGRGGRRAGVPVFPVGCWGSRCPRDDGRKRCLTCGTRAILRVHVWLGWLPAVGRVGRREEALAGLAAASYLSLARRERVQNLRPCSLRTAQPGCCPGRC